MRNIFFFLKYFLLQEVRGGGQGQAISKSEVAAAADGILGPLMDLLDGEHNISSLELRESYLSYL